MSAQTCPGCAWIVEDDGSDAGMRDTPGLLAQLRRHRLWLAIGVLVAGFAAASHFVAIGLLPPSIKLKPLARSTASTELLVGWHSSLRYTFPDLYLTDLSPRTAALADMMASPEVRGYVARAAAVPSSELAVNAPLWTNLQRIQQWDTGEKRANQIVTERDPYGVTLNNDPFAPVIDVVTQAPTAKAAARLAHGVAEGLRTYVSDIQTAAGTPWAGRYDVSQLVPVTVVPESMPLLANLGAFTFMAVFVLWCGLVLAVSSLARDLRAARGSSKVRAALDRSSGIPAGWSEPTRASTSTG
jgi:hypothetical protein